LIDIKNGDLLKLEEWSERGKIVRLDKLYRGSEDGFEKEIFHEKIDNKGSPCFHII
jgi:hypothetical protein